MYTLKLVTTIFSITIVLLGLSACNGGASAETSKAPVQTASSTTFAVDAANIFSINCSQCHGANREGKTTLGPALTVESLSGKTLAQFRDTIANGKSSGAMPDWKNRLSGEEIDAMAQYLLK